MRHIALVLLSCALTACNSMSTTTDTTDTVKEEKQKIATAKINTQLGIAYLGRRDVSRAKQKLLLALQQGPTIPEPWYSMAYFLETTGNEAEAERYYLKAISLAPSRGDAHNNYGTFLCRNGNYKASIQQFMTAAQDPNYLDPGAAYENAGLCALKLKDTKLAKYYLTRAIQQDPNRTASVNELAKLQHHELA